MLPDFAKSIVEAREAGKRPAMMVLVSDGDLHLHKRYPQNPVVRVRPGQRADALDWRFLAGLDVEVFTRSGPRAIEIVDAILPMQPLNLAVTHPNSMRSIRVVFYGVLSIRKESPWLSGNPV